MSAYTIERRFSIEELKLLIGALDNAIKEYDIQEARSLLIDNVPKAKLILKCFVEYYTRLEKYIEECINNIKSDGFRDWHIRDNELFLQATIGVILPLEDYYVLYSYLDSAKLIKNNYINNKIIALRDELAKEIAFKTSWKYLCDYGINISKNT